MTSIVDLLSLNTSERANLDSLANAPGEHKRFMSGDTIIAEGDSADSMFFVLEGKMQVIVNHLTVDERLVSTLKSGDMFGEMALFLQEPRTATVVAVGDVALIEITRDTIMEFLSESPENAFIIIELLCKRLKNVISSLADY
ncbi:MAG: cyclic nucleotide-binding domain-containing protein [Defluviitaleaceae bacterium]|nr:cyclic nucleotide-binding domain-containing protein [Defluviitaleaceae bacterium]